MIKICFITTVSLTLKTFVLKTAKYIHEHTDWDISFICNNDDEFAKDLPEYIHYYPVPMKRGISLAGISAMWEIKEIFRREKFDLIQYSTPNAALYAALAGKIAKVPIRLYCQWGMVYISFTGLKRVIFKTLEKFICHLSTWIEPDSNSNLNFALSEKLYSGKKSSVIWNGSACGVDLRKFDVAKKQEYREKVRQKYAIPMNAYVYGFVGRITRDKGINELLNAFKQNYEKSPNIYLLMVGATENDLTVDEDLFQWSKNCKNVIYTGYTNVVEEFLAAMDVYILPSYREGFGMGVIEASAMAVPVIVTNIPGPIDAMRVGKTGLVVEKKDVAGLKNAMEELFCNPEKGTTMGCNGRYFIENSFEQEALFGYILEDRKKLLGLIE